jgi:hypothetical protein
MALLRYVQHDRLALRGFSRLPPVASGNPPSTYQRSGIRQSHRILTSFWKPFSVARRISSATISDFRLCNRRWRNPLSFHCVYASFRRGTSVPLCSTGLPRICFRQAVRDKPVVGAHAGTCSGSWWCAARCRTAGVARVQEIGTAYDLGFVARFTGRLLLLALNVPVQPHIEFRNVFPHLFALYFARNFSSTDFTALARITGSRTFAPSRPPLLSYAAASTSARGGPPSAI